jgi:hypothetical protein
LTQTEEEEEEKAHIPNHQARNYWPDDRMAETNGPLGRERGKQKCIKGDLHGWLINSSPPATK